jgi:hypothetical protein
MYVNELPKIFVEYFKEYFIGLGVILYVALLLIIEFLDKRILRTCRSQLIKRE